MDERVGKMYIRKEATGMFACLALVFAMRVRIQRFSINDKRISRFAVGTSSEFLAGSAKHCAKFEKRV